MATGDASQVFPCFGTGAARWREAQNAWASVPKSTLDFTSGSPFKWLVWLASKLSGSSARTAGDDTYFQPRMVERQMTERMAQNERIMIFPDRESSARVVRYGRANRSKGPEFQIMKLETKTIIGPANVRRHNRTERDKRRFKSRKRQIA